MCLRPLCSSALSRVHIPCPRPCSRELCAQPGPRLPPAGLVGADDRSAGLRDPSCPSVNLSQEDPAPKGGRRREGESERDPRSQAPACPPPPLEAPSPCHPAVPGPGLCCGDGPGTHRPVCTPGGPRTEPLACRSRFLPAQNRVVSAQQPSVGAGSAGAPGPTDRAGGRGAGGGGVGGGKGARGWGVWPDAPGGGRPRAPALVERASHVCPPPAVV